MTACLGQVWGRREQRVPTHPLETPLLQGRNQRTVSKELPPRKSWGPLVDSGKPSITQERMKNGTIKKLQITS